MFHAIEVYSLLSSDRRKMTKILDQICKKAGMEEIEIRGQGLKLKELTQGLTVESDADLVVLCHCKLRLETFSDFAQLTVNFRQ